MFEDATVFVTTTRFLKCTFQVNKLSITLVLLYFVSFSKFPKK